MPILFQTVRRRAFNALILLACVAVPATVHAVDRIKLPGAREGVLGEALQVCFVYVSPIGSAGWTYQHDLGRQEMASALDDLVTTRFVESVAEGADAERVMRDLARSGCGLIFATSFGYLEPALRVAAEFPHVRFEHAGGYKNARNLATYDARWYEGRWLAGYLAGKTSKSGVAGYVAGFPVPEVVQGLNAFTLGMRAANPKAVVRVVWLSTWFDPAREREAALSLVAAGADVLANHTGSPAVAQTAEERGVKVVSYQSDMRSFAPNAQLAAVTQHWGQLYIGIVESILGNRWTNKPTVGGLTTGTVALSALHPDLPADLRADLAARQAAIISGRLKPFSGPLTDNRGRERLASGALTDAQIATMDWLVQGVVGALP
jgi:simple sugar transport system substrate-binding protein